MIETVYLSHPLTPRYDICCARVRTIRDGFELEYPGIQFRYPHNRLPGGLEPKDVAPEAISTLKRRMIVGELPADDLQDMSVGNLSFEEVGDFGFGPHLRPENRNAPLCRADAVWVVGPDCDDVLLDAELADGAGVPVYVLSEAAIMKAIEAYREAEAAIRRAKPVNVYKVPEKFREAYQVLCVYFAGMQGICGAPALDYSRQKGDGNAWGVQQRIAMATSKLTAATAIVERARQMEGWSPLTLEIMRCRIIVGMSFEDIFEHLHVPERTARWRITRGMELINKALFFTSNDNTSHCTTIIS